MTAEQIAAFVAAFGMIGGIFKVFYGQVADVKDKFSVDLARSQQAAVDMVKALTSSTEVRFAESAERRHELANRMQLGFDTVNREYVRRDDFSQMRKEMSDALKDIGAKIDQIRDRRP